MSNIILSVEGRFAQPSVKADPANMEPLQATLTSVFVNAGLPMTQPHMLEVEQLRAEDAEQTQISEDAAAAAGE